MPTCNLRLPNAGDVSGNEHPRKLVDNDVKAYDDVLRGHGCQSGETAQHLLSPGVVPVEADKT